MKVIKDKSKEDEKKDRRMKVLGSYEKWTTQESRMAMIMTEWNQHVVMMNEDRIVRVIIIQQRRKRARYPDKINILYIW